MEASEVKKLAETYVNQETNPVFKKEVEDLLASDSPEAAKDLEDRFYTRLAFGTGGMRGVIGGGYNRMNSYVIRRTTQGLANYVTKQNFDNPSAAIAYDSRHFSKEFARDAACVLAAAGIKTYIFKELRPTPQLSFAVRHLGATIGIVITASHNPAEYNGYKVYWNDGAQIVPPHDKGIVEEVSNLAGSAAMMDRAEAMEKGLIVELGPEIDEEFFNMVGRVMIRPELVREKGSDLNIVYTPLHGTGSVMVEPTLKRLGIEVMTVPEQREPDGNFPTVKFPNPEEASAMELALKLGRKHKADIVLGTDPDSDRIGIAVPDAHGEYTLVSGNQLGCLLADYIFSSRKDLGKLPKRPAFINTIVTTPLQAIIAKSHGAECYQTLTGFKWIAGKIREFESQADGPSFVFGCEESYGFMVGAEVRDKDAVSASAMTAEMALYHVKNGKSVLQHLDELYEEHGYWEDRLISRYFKGQAGLTVMKGMMAALRENPPDTLGGISIAKTRDYLSGKEDLPKSDVLQFELADGSVVNARPSGTEPKIKFYISCPADRNGSGAGRTDGGDRSTAARKVDAIEAEIQTLIDKAAG